MLLWMDGSSDSRKLGHESIVSDCDVVGSGHKNSSLGNQTTSNSDDVSCEGTQECSVGCVKGHTPADIVTHSGNSGSMSCEINYCDSDVGILKDVPIGSVVSASVVTRSVSG